MASNRHLKVAVGQWTPWCDILSTTDEKGLRVQGIAVEIFETIATKLNYTYTYITPDDGEWGRPLPNGTWTGLIGMIVDGSLIIIILFFFLLLLQRADMSIGPFAETHDRSLVIDYSSNIYLNDQGIFLPKPRQEKDLSSFARPLSQGTWIMLIIASIVCVFAGFFLKWIINSGIGDEDNPKSKETFKPIWILSNLFNEPLVTLPTTNTGRVFLGTWLLAVFIIDTAYIGVLTSILTVPIIHFPVNSLEELISYGKIPWALESGTFLHHLVMEAEEGLYKELSKKTMLVYSCFKARHRVKNEHIAVLCDYLSMKKSIHVDFSETEECNYHIAKKPLFQSSSAFAYRKGSKLGDHIDKRIINLKESGIISRLVLASSPNATHCLSGKRHDVTNPVLGLMDLAGIFLIFIAGLLLGIIALAAEILVSI